jgi:hypothetical protein
MSFAVVVLEKIPEKKITEKDGSDRTPLDNSLAR